MTNTNRPTDCEALLQDRDAADSLARALRADVQRLTARAEALRTWIQQTVTEYDRSTVWRVPNIDQARDLLRSAQPATGRTVCPTCNGTGVRP